MKVRKVKKNKDLDVIAGKLYNNNDIIILTNIGIFIFNLNKNLKGENFVSKLKEQNINNIKLPYFTKTNFIVGIIGTTVTTVAAYYRKLINFY